MAMMRLSSGSDEPKEKSKPSHDVCAVMHHNIAAIRVFASALKSTQPSVKSLQTLLDNSELLCNQLTQLSKKLRTPDSRELRDLGVVIYNQASSLVTIVAEDLYSASIAKDFRGSLIVHAENFTDRFLEKYEIDLVIKPPTKVKPKVVEEPVEEEPVVAKKKKVKSGKTIARLSSFADLATVSKLVKEPEPEIVETKPEEEPVVQPQKKAKKLLDFTDRDSLTFSKFKPYAKQFVYEDTNDTGVSLMPRIPVMCLSRPAVFDPERIQHIKGLRLESVCGYPVFIQQLIAGIQVSANDALVTATDKSVYKYILSTAKQEYGVDFDTIGDPRWLNFMLCFWLIPKTQLEELRRVYPRFQIEDWTTAFMTGGTHETKY